MTSRIPARQKGERVFGQTCITPWHCASIVYDTPIKATCQHHTTVDDQFHMVLS